MLFHSYPITLLAALCQLSLAQTTSTCNPTEETCSADTALSSSTYSIDFTSGSGDWTTVAGSVTYGSNGAEFTVSESGDSPTIETPFYIFFGQVTVLMRAATGTGIVSSAILESDDLDEIDWEWLGGSVDQVQSNYYGKGNTTSYDRAIYHTVSDTQSTTHNYTLVWTSASTKWYIDGTLVRTLNYADAVSGTNYPQTPMRVKLGIWAGGDSGNNEGTISWAGGETDYSDGPFTMYVEKVEITNFSPATSYTYGDTSGDWESIEVTGGTVNSGSSSSSSVTTSSSSSDSTSSDSSDSSSSSGSKSPSTTLNTITGTATASGMWWTASASAIIASAKNSAPANWLSNFGLWKLAVSVGFVVFMQ